MLLSLCLSSIRIILIYQWKVYDFINRGLLIAFYIFCYHSHGISIPMWRVYKSCFHTYSSAPSFSFLLMGTWYSFFFIFYISNQLFTLPSSSVFPPPVLNSELKTSSLKLDFLLLTLPFHSNHQFSSSSLSHWQL